MIYKILSLYCFLIQSINSFPLLLAGNELLQIPTPILFMSQQNFLTTLNLKPLNLEEADANDDEQFVPFLPREYVKCNVCLKVIDPKRFVEHFDKCRKVYNQISDQELIIDIPEDFKADEDFSYELPKKEVISVNSPNKVPAKRKRPSSSHKKSKKSRVLDLDRNCGVLTDQGPCFRSITCKNHSVAMKRVVAGRTKPFEDLIALHQFKQTEAQLSKRARTQTEESRQMDTDDQMVVFFEQFQRDAVSYNLDTSYPYPESTSFLSRNYLLLRNIIQSDSALPKSPKSPKKETVKLKSSEAKA